MRAREAAQKRVEFAEAVGTPMAMKPADIEVLSGRESWVYEARRAGMHSQGAWKEHIETQDWAGPWWVDDQDEATFMVRQDAWDRWVKAGSVASEMPHEFAKFLRLD